MTPRTFRSYFCVIHPIRSVWMPQAGSEMSAKRCSGWLDTSAADYLSPVSHSKSRKRRTELGYFPYLTEGTNAASDKTSGPQAGSERSPCAKRSWLETSAAYDLCPASQLRSRQRRTELGYFLPSETVVTPPADLSQFQFKTAAPNNEASGPRPTHPMKPLVLVTTDLDEALKNVSENCLFNVLLNMLPFSHSRPWK